MERRSAGTVPMAADEQAIQVLQAARRAAGGAALAAIHTISCCLELRAGGLRGSAQTWDDILGGCFREEFRLGPATGANGFDGAAAWSQDSSGQSRREDSHVDLQTAQNEAFRRSLSYWFARRPGSARYVGTRAASGARLDVIQAVPEAGRPFELWFDSRTHLLKRVVCPEGARTTTTTFSQYRSVEGVRIPFHARQSTGNPLHDTITQILSVRFNVPLKPKWFEMPPPPPVDFGFKNRRAYTTIPFRLINNHIYVEVRLNGKGPFLFLCDTGASNTITPALARSLKLKTQGRFEAAGVGERKVDFALCRMDRMELGGAWLKNQMFFVLPLDSLPAAEGVEPFGLIGYEMFKRFVVRIDYERQSLTLSGPRKSRPGRKRIEVGFRFANSTPVIDGEIDGTPGDFGIDTGSRSTLTLATPFVKRHNLVARYSAGFESIVGCGVGGNARGLLARAGVLKLGSIQIDNVPVELSLQKRGAPAETTADGSVGGGLLKRFNLTVDYGKQTIVFEPNANAAEPEAFDRSGLWLNAVRDHFLVVHVTAKSPGDKAGLRPGDEIIEIAGEPVKQWKLYELRQHFRTAKPGSIIAMRVVRRGRARSVVLTLADLV